MPDRPGRRRPAPPVLPATGEHRAEEVETYTALATELVVEALAGTGRPPSGARSPR
ncbi:hypothetical protein [Streptomyces sp. NPDC101178]|uniref:hypothetical protein n=1 Tax=Streptomyces sp. NPDC101178 TaxID=3366124 RepID=UPI00381E6D35